jgi:cytochrome c oxidase cbb3-type subunit I/II
MTNNDTNHGSESSWGQFHRRVLEGKAGLFAILTTVAISIGGIVEIAPMFSTIGPEEAEWVTPYTPLEVAGRDIYIREGCYLCHSQMIRPMRAELLRYGEWSRAAEYQYDRPFLLGSRRIGPDLQRIGGKYPDGWHFEHMRDPRSVSPGSVMPAYSWLLEWTIDPDDVAASVRALRLVGTPYSGQDVADVPANLERQGGEIVGRLIDAGIETQWDAEIVALIAYLQRLGQDGRAELARRSVEGGTALAATAPEESSTSAGGGE